MRRHGEHARLERTALDHARRVARRGVLVKDGAGGEELRRLGLTPLRTRRNAAISFGWADARAPTAPPAE